jgi:very-short-patch-repair endonuclease
MQRAEISESHRQGALAHYALHPMSEETKAKISQSNSGKIRPPDWGRHISEAKKGKPSSMKGIPQPSSRYKRTEETKRRMSEAKRSDEAKRRMSEGRKRMLAEHPFTNETKAKMSQSRHEYFRTHPNAGKEHGAKLLGRKNEKLSYSMKRLWEQPSHVEKAMRAMRAKPNKQEILLGQMIDALCPNTFKYNGDCRLGIVLNRRIPDFVNVNGKKQVIEFFGSHWHKAESRGDVETIKCYKAVGWDCLVIWDKEFKTDAHAVESKLRAFVGRCDE